MRKSSVKVKNPCNVNWKSLEQNGRNRFCAICDKKIVDFRNMSNPEIISYLHDSNERICGLINRASPNTSFTHKKNLIVHSIIAFSSFLFGGKAASQSINESNAIAIESTAILTQNIKIENHDQQQIIVSGVVTDEAGEGLPNLNIIIKGTTKGTQTDMNGMYSIEVPEKTILIFSYIGFETKEVNVQNKTEINVTMISSTIDLGEVVVISKWYTPRGLWQRIKRIF
ncbi:carboxypeptidase-like regulatory domain-containing protein [Ekhidna sp.]